MDRRQTVLIVEDEAVNRRILKKILAGDYDIIEAENGKVAWEMLVNHKKDQVGAVLLDINMPVMDGYAVLAKMQQASMTELPVVVMTAESDTKSEQKALDNGAWDFVTKPYNPQILKSRLRNAIARRQVNVFRKMQKMAAHDPLTGLHNRTRMFEKTRKLVDDHPDLKFIFLRADIDRFALYNAAFSEEEGNRLLCYIAGLFRQIANEHELCSYGRMNADVFASCLPYSGDEKVLVQAVQTVQEKLVEYRKNYRLEISVGAYVIEEPTLSVEEFYLRASIGAQKCKRQYGQHIGFYDENSRSRATQEIEISNEMEQALEEKQFLVYLQPKVSLSTDLAVGAEALVRWRHPDKGLVSPGIFIPVFERNGFIAKLDYYVWESTCQMLKKWCDAGREPNPVSINISRISLYNPHLVEDLLELVGRYGIDIRLLQLEITESAYMTSPELMQETIHNLRSAGFTILMDDFGSGYSSLNTLKDMEVDILKIDMKFLPVGKEVQKGEIILASMIKMAKWLGMEVVVEGVETKEQRDFLEGTGCESVQGYFYARPMPQEEYERDYVYCDEQSKRQCAEQEAHQTDRSQTVLVIDDVEVDRAILTQMLQDKYYIQNCISAEEALTYLNRHADDVRLILVDNEMPGMSGMDFLTFCQDNERYNRIPQIMITAHESAEMQVQAFQHGAYDYITKPLVREVVMARVNHVMNVAGVR